MDATIITETQKLFQKIVKFLDGEFDNFQQAWQENTEEDIHRIEVTEKHRHLHSVFEKQTSTFNKSTSTTFIIKHHVGRVHPKLIHQSAITFIYDKKKDALQSTFAELPLGQQKESDTELILWTQNQTAINGIST